MVNKVEIKELAEKATGLAKNVWFAGLGVYGKAYEEAQSQYEKTNKEISQLIDDLVTKGKTVEGELQEKTSEIKEKSTTTVEDRIVQIKNGLKLKSKNAELGSQLDDLNSKLDQVIKSLNAKSAKSKAA